MDDAHDLVLAHQARTPTEATLLAGRLQADGIRTFVEGSMPTDEVAMSRQLMNTGAVKILVPSSQLDRARALLNEGRVSDADLEAAALANGEIYRPRSAERGMPIGWMLLAVVAVAAAIWLLVSWLDQRARVEGEHPQFEFVQHGQGVDATWRENRNLAERLSDRDGNGVYETVELFDRQGELLQLWTDSDQNGYQEEQTSVAADGTETRFVDRDGDGRWDQMRVVRDGKPLQRFVFAAGRGWVEQR